MTDISTPEEIEKIPKRVKMPAKEHKTKDGIIVETTSMISSKGERPLNVIVKNDRIIIVPKGKGKQIAVVIPIGKHYLKGVMEAVGVPFYIRSTTGNRVKRGI